jgi:hypothetical protein
MRASLYLVGFAAASLMGAGLFEIGCSSSSSPAAPAADAATEATTDDSGDDSAAPMCTPVMAGTRADTIDGGSAWACTQSMCNTKVLTACSSDCSCNNAVLTALECIATDGGGAQACFTKTIPSIMAGDPNTTPLITCLTNAGPPCAGIVITDGGKDGSTDSGSTTDASDAGPPPADASDGG